LTLDVDNRLLLKERVLFQMDKSLEENENIKKKQVQEIATLNKMHVDIDSKFRPTDKETLKIKLTNEGHKYTVSRSVLCTGNHKLAKMFSSSESLDKSLGVKDIDGYITLPYPPEFFDRIMKYLVEKSYNDMAKFPTVPDSQKLDFDKFLKELEFVSKDNVQEGSIFRLLTYHNPEKPIPEHKLIGKGLVDVHLNLSGFSDKYSKILSVTPARNGVGNNMPAPYMDDEFPFISVKFPKHTVQIEDFTIMGSDACTR